MIQYGLVGYPLKHSFSQRFFTQKFADENIDASYSNFEIPLISLFPQIISTPALKGLNVTIPYKEQIIQYLDELDPQAAEIGAVNVVKVIRDKNQIKLKGYNTDIIGFQQSIAPLIKPIHKQALVLGTGGASKAVVAALRNLGITPTYVSRTPRDGELTYKDLNSEIMSRHTVIVNCSPLGTFPNVDEAPDIPYSLLNSHHLLYDLVYNPAETTFLRLGKEQGATTKSGAEMLELQALAAWQIWND